MNATTPGLFIARSHKLGQFAHMRKILTLSLILASLAAGPAAASCLSQGEMREVVASGQVIPPVNATRAAQGAVPGGEVTRVELCRGGGGFIYQITVLQRDGRVVQVVVDGATGALR